MSRPPNYEFQEWWNKQRDNKNVIFINNSINPNGITNTHFAVEIAGPISDLPAHKERTRSSRQLSWVYLLKFQQIAPYFAFAFTGLISIVKAAKRRVNSSDSVSHLGYDSRLYRVIKLFLIVVVLWLGFELVAYYKGCHISPPTVGSSDVEDLVKELLLTECSCSSTVEIKCSSTFLAKN